MKSPISRLLGIVLILLVFPAVLHAGLLPVKVSEGVYYVTGGIGLDESTAIKELRADYPLAVVFAESTTYKRDRYISGVEVEVEHAGSMLFKTRTQGPYLLLKAPPGTYRITAVHNGVPKTRNIRIGTTPRQVGFAWPAVDDHEDYVRGNERKTEVPVPPPVTRRPTGEPAVVRSPVTPPPPVPDDPVSLRVVQVDNDVSYLTGGIGLEESTAIKEMRSDYPLTMVFAETTATGRNQYLYAVVVEIRRGNNLLFETRTQGPYLLVRLPPGSYRVTATHNGIPKSQTITVGTKPRQVGWSWKAPKEQPMDSMGGDPHM